MAGQKPSDGTFETFDSGSGPTQKGDAEAYDHRDKNLSSQGSEGQDKDLGIPEVPLK